MGVLLCISLHLMGVFCIVRVPHNGEDLHRYEGGVGVI